jgi:pyruvate ferredoxin oxidoreductase delta subunit
VFSVLASKAKTSKANKTGSWRGAKRPKLLHVNCINCGLCKLVCPEACITGKVKNEYKVDFEYCKGCGICVMICPKKDVIMEIEEK